jgi:hypothetical protein
MSDEHYFLRPKHEFRAKEISVELDGRKVSVTTAGGVFRPDHVDRNPGAYWTTSTNYRRVVT